jgi:putative addiction module component (TIGR02574 family)
MQFSGHPANVGATGKVGVAKQECNLKCYSSAMNSIAISDILSLPIQDRIQLVEAIWDSIAEVPEAIELSDSQRLELDKRLAAYQESPSLGSPWSEVRARITKA